MIEDVELSTEISTGYVPRPLQRKLHQGLKRFNVIVCHRRFGKTIFSLNHMIDRALRSSLPMPRFAYIAPTFGQAKRVVWDQLKHYTKNIPGVETHEQDLRMDIPGNKARIMLLSAENPESLKGIYLDGAILDEYASMNPTVWSEVIRPTLTDRRGWATFIGTPRGQNNFYDLYMHAKKEDSSNWFAARYKASETGLISKEELDSNRATMTEDEYEQEFECSFTAALSGAYFGRDLAKAESEGRIGKFPVDDSIPVDTYWDLGLNDATSIWFVQSLRGNHRFIDYFEVSGLSIKDILVEVKKKNYQLGRFVLPHDAKARDMSSGRTQVQDFNKHGVKNITVIPRVGTKRESINAARMSFSKCFFDSEKCALGLKALGEYQKKWNTKGNVYEDAPLHNWASNAADAFQQFALGQREDSRDNRDFSNKSSYTSITEYNPYA